MINFSGRGKRYLLAVVVIVAAGAAGASTAVSATPVSGEIGRDPIASGVLSGPQKSEAYGIEFKTKAPVKVEDFVLTYKPGATSGWHSHPGIVIATVISGSVQRTLGCGPVQTFNQGDTFTEVGPHFVANIGTIDASLSITLIYPKTWTTSTRINEEEPVC